MDAILAATSRVLVKEGYPAATTTRVAEVAGVSIGSLYQYFPTREALVAALVERHIGEVLGFLSATRVVPEEQSLEDTVRSFVKTVLAVHAVDPKLHAVITQNFAHERGFEMIAAFARQARLLVRETLHENRHRVRSRNIDLSAFILVYAMQGVLNACVVDDGPSFEDEELCEELTLLLLKYLEPTRPPRARVRRGRQPHS